MFEPKVPAISAAIGFVLSFLVGILSGAAFPVVLLRAVIMAVMFAVLAVVGRFLVQKFLPELLSPAQAAGTEVDDSGNVVNITIGENENDGEFFPGADSGESDSMVPDFLQSAQHAETSPSSGTFEPEEFVPSKPGFSGADSGKRPEPPKQSAGSTVSPVTAGTTGGLETSGGLDILPDLEDFLPDDNPEASNDAKTDGSTSGDSRFDSRFEASDLKGSAVESETMVKAIRTILSRES